MVTATFFVYSFVPSLYMVPTMMSSMVAGFLCLTMPSSAYTSVGRYTGVERKSVLQKRPPAWLQKLGPRTVIIQFI